MAGMSKILAELDELGRLRELVANLTVEISADLSPRVSPPLSCGRSSTSPPAREGSRRQGWKASRPAIDRPGRYKRVPLSATCDRLLCRPAGRASSGMVRSDARCRRTRIGSSRSSAVQLARLGSAALAA
jgi:hypothetical protein